MFSYDLNMMHAWRAVDLRIYLVKKKNHGYSISAQSYDFCPRLIQLDILDFSLSHVRTCLDGFLTKKMGIFPLLYVHIRDYLTTFEVF